MDLQRVPTQRMQGNLLLASHFYSYTFTALCFAVRVAPSHKNIKSEDVAHTYILILLTTAVVACKLLTSIMMMIIIALPIHGEF